jgi:hypothetical protein
MENSCIDPIFLLEVKNMILVLDYEMCCSVAVPASAGRRPASPARTAH